MPYGIQMFQQEFDATPCEHVYEREYIWTDGIAIFCKNVSKCFLGNKSYEQTTVKINPQT